MPCQPVQRTWGRGGTTSGRGTRMNVNGVSRFDCRPTFFTPPHHGRFVVSGVTRDANDAALGNCIVHCFATDDDRELGQTVSDGSGNFSIQIASNGWACYLVAYLAGTPNRAGTTDITIYAAPV